MSMTLYIICHRHILYLYRMDIDRPVLLKSDTESETIIAELVSFNPKKVMIIDNGSSNSLKIETTSRTLSLYEYAQWAWQKWRHIRQNSLFATVRILRQYNSILVATSPFNGPLVPFLEKLDQYAVTSNVYNYPLALIMGIYAEHRAHLLSQPLLVIVDKDHRSFLAFLLKEKLVFVRQHTLSSTDAYNDIGPKNIILDTIRYLEKTFTVSNIVPMFFLEDTSWETMFRVFFPNSMFHIPEKDRSFLPIDDTFVSPDVSVFDGIVLKKTPSTAVMHLLGSIFQRSWIRRLVPYIQLANIVALLICVYSMYTAFCLMSCNQQLGKKLDKLTQSFASIQNQLSQMPIASCHIDQIEKTRTLSETQYKALIQYFALLEHVLNDRCIIRSLSMSPKKSRLSLQMTDPTLTMDDLIDLGQNALPHFQITVPAQTPSSIFVVETKSPLSYEKTSD
jgi:hypothetical protein